MMRGEPSVNAASMLTVPGMLTTCRTEIDDLSPVLGSNCAEIIVLVRVGEYRSRFSFPWSSQQKILCRVFDHKDMRFDRYSSNIDRNIMTNTQTRTSNLLVIPKTVDMPLNILVDQEVQTIECPFRHDIDFRSVIKQGFDLDSIVNCDFYSARRTSIIRCLAGYVVDTGANDTRCRSRYCRHRLRSELFNRYTSLPSLFMNECR